MNRRVFVAVGRYAIVYPLVTLVVVAGTATAAGIDIGLSILVLSMVGAAILTGVFVSDTRAMRSAAAETNARRSSLLNLRSEPGDFDGIPYSRRDRVSLFGAGLFVVSALLVLYLGGLFDQIL